MVVKVYNKLTPDNVFKHINIVEYITNVNCIKEFESRYLIYHNKLILQVPKDRYRIEVEI